METEKITIEGPGPLAPIGTLKTYPAIDWTKPVRMQGFPHCPGQLVHIYAIDHDLVKPIIGRYAGDGSVLQWGYDGVFIDRQPQNVHMNLENVP